MKKIKFKDKQIFNSYTTNPCLLDKKHVEVLCRKSYWCFKSRWRWRRLIEQTGATVAMIESEMDKIIKRHDKMLQHKRKLEAQNEPKNGSNNDGDSSGSGASNNDGQEVRPE